MDIPKNTTQIGELRGNRKIFIEDYVISYIKQLCRQEPDTLKRIAFYGVLRTEGEQKYYFIYGGSRITIHEKNDKFLNTKDYEEVTMNGGKYFEEYIPLGFVTIEDELPEGVYLFSEGKTEYIKGYHIFYEKNDSMLAFLIDKQREARETPPKQPQETEIVNRRSTQPDYENKRVAQTELTRPKHSEKEKTEFLGEIKLFGIVKSMAAALLIVLCVTAVSTMNGLGKIEDVQGYFQRAFREMREKKIPDKESGDEVFSEEVIATSGDVVNDFLVEENRAAILEENKEIASISDNEVASDAVVITEEVTTPETEVVTEVAAPTEPKTHIIASGETLISISKTFYGDDSKVKEICELNGITNSDNIQIGQKIILP